ncbi:MAG: OmpA family protein [Cytophagales bacterium]|nr:OmpA family protein [Cytophagales bacterium]
MLSDSSYRNTKDGVFPISPSYERLNRTIYNRSTGLWTRFGYTYEAKGGERFLTIGNFSTDGKTRSQFIESAQSNEPMLAKAAFFYIDDVKVIKVGGVPQTPLLTGYTEIKTEEDYILKNIQFRFNDFTLLESSYPELKRLVEIMRYYKTWKVIVNGHTDDVGTEAYNLELSLHRAGSVADYLIDQGINPARIKTQGFGKQTPLVKGTDETSRSTNRRVELRFSN